MDLTALLAQLVPVAIVNIHREYPNGILHHYVDATAVGTPATLHPAFYGCYDWHSAVEGHWQLVRALRLAPTADFAEQAIAALDQSFTPANLAVEVAYVTQRPSFEMPYGMAWFLQLMAEVRGLDNEHRQRWQAILAPLEAHAAARFRVYLARLPHPIRTGLHSQTAFALGLAWDWAQIAGDKELAALIAERARHFYLADVAAPLAYEPSGSDFLSPALAEADLLRRLLPTAELSDWLWGFFGADMVETLPQRLKPVRVVDHADGQLAHYAGLNLSRAWMLQGIARALPTDDPRQPMLLALAQAHQELGLPDALHPDYAVSHWAPAYALYLISQRGLIGK